MRKHFFNWVLLSLCVLSLFTLRFSYGDDGERQKLLTAIDTIDQMRAQAEQMQQDIDTLKIELSAARALQDQVVAQSAKLTEAVKKIDAARLQDVEAINKDLKFLAAEIAARKSKATSSPTVDKAKKSVGDTAPIPPAKEEVGFEHIVEKGHTLSAIAGAYGVTVDEIRKANNLKTNVLKVGQKLFIPKKK
ncbi:MAG: LysM peptidoglycan-binding domain-containing protein [Verrucomicrobiota bacterium]|nr:LysM peptidoglycan-binding domain-containing protein [Verrucomicrobiota bacterium]